MYNSKQSTPCEGLGCGPQETFRNCADVRIVGSRSLLPTQDNPRALFVTDERGIRPLVVRTQTCVATPAYKMFHRPVHAGCWYKKIRSVFEIFLGMIDSG
jgi:hypothetical protein